MVKKYAERIKSHTILQVVNIGAALNTHLIIIVIVCSGFKRNVPTLNNKHTHIVDNEMLFKKLNRTPGLH